MRHRVVTSSWLAALALAPAWAGGCGNGGGSTPPPANRDAGSDRGPQPPEDTAPPLNDAGTYCDPPTGPGTTHSANVTTSETWTAAGSPHLVTKDIEVGDPKSVATLSVESCAVVEFAPGTGLSVAPAGKRGGLLAMAVDAYHPITFTGMNETPGSWKGIYFGTGDGTNDDSSKSGLAQVIIDYAGAPAGHDEAAGLFLDGTGKPQTLKPSIALAVNGLTIRHSARYGLYTTRNGHLAPASSSSVQLTDNGYRAARVEVEYLGSLPGGLVSGNKEEGIEVQGGDGKCFCSDVSGSTCAEGLCVRTSTNWPGRGVPIFVKGIVHIGNTTGPTAKPTTVTVIAGATFRMAGDSGILVGVDTKQKGALRIKGDAADLVTFTSDTQPPAAGSWRGIVYGLYSDWTGDGSVVQYAKIEGAGKAVGLQVPKTCGSASIDGTHGALIFDFYDDPMRNPFPMPIDPTQINNIDHVTISASAGHGIVRGWDSTTAPLDYTAAGLDNTFDMIAGCKQTNPQTGGTCSPCM